MPLFFTEKFGGIVMFVFREIYYLQNETPTKRNNETDDKFALRVAEWEQKKIDLANQAEAIIAKNRHGPVDNIKLYFNGEFGRFSDLERNEYPGLN